MIQPRLPIDHVGILAPEIQALVAEFKTLGFNVLGPAELASIDTEGVRHGLGQFSAHVMFDDDYIELTAVERPTPDHHLSQYLQAPWGIRILILSSDNINATHDACERSRLQPTSVQVAGRTLDYQDGAEARFRWFGLPAANWPDALVGYVQHLSRGRVFDPSVSQHENGAKGLNRVYYCADSLPEQYGALATNGAHDLQLVAPQDYGKELGFAEIVTSPFAAVGIDVEDLQATAQYFKNRGIEWQRVDAGISIRLNSGNCLVFM